MNQGGLNMIERLQKSKGYSLVEVLVALALAGVVSAALYTAFVSQNRSYVKEDQVVDMQQNLRAGMDLMVREIRMAGYDPSRTNNFGLVDMQLRDINDNPSLAGNGTIRYKADFDGDGVIGGPNEDVTYSLYDSPVTSPAGALELGRNTGGGRQTVFSYVEALRFAFAFDNNGDDIVDTTTAGGNIIWAVDTDNDNILDLAIDANDDGRIDLNDNPAGTPLTAMADVGANVPLNRVKAVQIWLLVRSSRPEQGFNDTRTYVLANQRYTPPANVSSFPRRILSESFKIRNL